MKAKVKEEPEWVRLAGRTGEFCHCQRCGVGLRPPAPVPVGELADLLNAFSRIHALCQPGHEEPTPTTAEEWLRGRDTGISSKTIFRVMTGREDVETWPSWPRDPADFGRCHRLLKLMPEWRARLSEVAAAFPDSPWPKLIERWDRLEYLFEAESPSGACPKLYDEMKRCRA